VNDIPNIPPPTIDRPMKPAMAGMAARIMTQFV